MGRSLTGSRCLHCATVAFPRARGCQSCGRSSQETIALGSRGTVWGFTVQRFAPKSPPYVEPPGGFVPFAVGYVELLQVHAALPADARQLIRGAAEGLATATHHLELLHRDLRAASAPAPRPTEGESAP